MDIYLPLTTKRSNMLLNLVSGIPLTHQNAAQVFSLMALANLYQARGALLALAG
jgi:hypothetical protein